MDDEDFTRPRSDQPGFNDVRLLTVLQREDTFRYRRLGDALNRLKGDNIILCLIVSSCLKYATET